MGLRVIRVDGSVCWSMPELRFQGSHLWTGSRSFLLSELRNAGDKDTKWTVFKNQGKANGINGFTSGHLLLMQNCWSLLFYALLSVSTTSHKWKYQKGLKNIPFNWISDHKTVGCPCTRASVGIKPHVLRSRSTTWSCWIRCQKGQVTWWINSTSGKRLPWWPHDELQSRWSWWGRNTRFPHQNHWAQKLLHTEV